MLPRFVIFPMDGRLLLIRVDRLETVDDRGAVGREWPLNKRDWAAVTPTHDGVHCRIANAASGEAVKISPSSGERVAVFEDLMSEPRPAATSVVEYWPG